MPFLAVFRPVIDGMRRRAVRRADGTLEEQIKKKAIYPSLAGVLKVISAVRNREIANLCGYCLIFERAWVYV